MADLLARLARRTRIAEHLALVVAHPDDETIGAGASLHLFDALTLVHATDGAPRNLSDAHAAGFPDAQAYAQARRAELAAALAAAGVSCRLVELGAPDQGGTQAMHDLADSLTQLFAAAGTQAVLTHAYEGGHPDHDATAFAVHHAARRLPRPPAIFEFAGYHAGSSGMQTGTFLPGGAAPTIVALDPEEQARKRRMLDCFTTQRAMLAAFGTTHEIFRPAPSYDFAVPPHGGKLHYETYDWGMTGAAWRARAAA